MGHSTASGRRNEPAKPVLADRVAANEALSPKPGMKITKIAETEFEAAYRNARQYVRSYGAEEASNLSIKPNFNSYVSMQTLRGVQAKINSEQRNIERDLKLGIITQEEARDLRAALNTIQRGLNSSYKQHRDFWDGNF